MNGGGYFKSNSNNDKFFISGHLNCESSHIIYLLECPCHLQYVGRTYQKLRSRVNNYRNNITHGYLKHRVSRHAASHHYCDFTNFTIIPIEHIHKDVEDRKEICNQREMYWICKLNTLTPIGLNKALENV